MSERIIMFQQDLQSSASDFARIIWPVISEWCGGGDCIDVEKSTTGIADNVLSLLDMRAGIDQLQVLSESVGLRGIASRIQWGYRSWDTFSVRASRSTGTRTELSKRSYALSNRGVLYPHWTVQAYVTDRINGTLLSVAVAYTDQLIPYIQQYGKHQNNLDGHSSFLYVNWSDYYKSGNFIHYMVGGREYETNGFSEAV